MKHISKKWRMVLGCICLYALAPLSSAFGAGFMYLDGVEGESTDQQHPGWIDVLSSEWSMDATASTDKRGGGGEISDIVITVVSDASSPYLALACMQGKSFDTVDFELVDDTGRVVSTMRLSDVKVKKGASSSRSDTVPTESWTLSYTRVQWTYYPADRERAPSEFVWTRAGGI